MTQPSTIFVQQFEYLTASGPLSWYAVRVRSRAEKMVSSLLQAKGIAEFLPTYVALNNWSDRVKKVELPLFPGYVFCRVDVTHRTPVLATPGVVEIVGIGKTPAPIDDCEIEALQAVVRSGRPAIPWSYLREGDKVRITRGSLKDVEGIVVTEKKGFRIVLSVNLLQRSIAVELDRDSIEPKN